MKIVKPPGIVLFTALMLAGTSVAAQQPDRCAQLKERLDNLQEELASVIQRKAKNADEAESNAATARYVQREIEQVEVQRSANQCPNSKPLSDLTGLESGAAPATNPPPTPPAGAQGPTGPGAPATPAAPDIWSGDYDTHTELGTLHLEPDPDYIVNAGYAAQANFRGPAISCPGGDPSGKMYRGWFQPAGYPAAQRDPEATVWVIGCIDGSVLRAKFSDHVHGKYIGTFEIAPVPPAGAYKGGYSLTQDVAQVPPLTPWVIDKKEK